MTKTLSMTRPAHVLLVEDNAADACLMLEFLKECKTIPRVTVLRDGEEALNFLKRRDHYFSTRPCARPDLVLLDLNIPLLDGRDLLRELKGDPELMGIPVVVFSGSARMEGIMNCYTAKADYHFVKPDKLDQFSTTMLFLDKFWLEPLGSDRGN